MVALVLALLLLQGPDEVRAEPRADVRAEVRVAPSSVEVGEPVDVVVEVAHPPGLAPAIPGLDLALPDQWVVLDAQEQVTLPAPGGGFTTRRALRVAGLAPAEAFPALEIPVARRAVGARDASPEADETFSAATAEVPLTVTTVLGDALEQRPLRGFREPSAEPSPELLPWWSYAVAAPLLVLAGVLVARRLRRRAAPAAPAVPPLERLEHLTRGAADAGDRAAVQALHYALTALLREAAEERLGRAHPGATDREWLALLSGEARLSARAREGLERVIERAEAVKYAREEPTRWAVDETLEVARGVLAEVTGGGRP